jgi:ADP-dependent NAD(P)H-hydrate dehydratase / NAD(P)H-hydrate epimerase
MLDPVKQTLLYDWNASYANYPVSKLMERAGRGIAQTILAKYGKYKRIAFFCGSGNNGGDGFVAARYLQNLADVEVYLVSAENEIKNTAASQNWDKWQGHKLSNVRVKDIPDHFEIVVECLMGTGTSGKLKEPYRSVIKKLNTLHGHKVAVDLPALGFKADLVISMMFPKVKGASVVDIGYPKNLLHQIGIGEVKVLQKALPTSHKGENGKLLIIAGSEQFHGAALLANKTASRIVDLVYFASVPENNALIKDLKSKLCDFIALPRDTISKFIPKVNAVLLGPGLGASQETAILSNTLLAKYPKQKFILDADALTGLNLNLLTKNCILTPHKREFKTLFMLTPTLKNVQQMAKKYGCTIVLKGVTDYVCDTEQYKQNTTGNTGMTKGGTGDVLAGLIAALACQNDNFLAASAGVFLNGLAGDRLVKKVSTYYNASDLVAELPRTLKWCEDFRGS